MKFKYHNKIIGEPLQYFYEEETFELPKKLWERKNAKPFNFLKNGNFEETFAIHKYKLISDYIHQLEQEQFDGN